MLKLESGTEASVQGANLFVGVSKDMLIAIDGVSALCGSNSGL